MSLQPFQERAIPKMIGHYTILRLLGEGGMGDVYLAERNDEMRRLVALKVLKNAVSRSASARFEMERNTLAQMRHPNVAQVYNAGETPEGYSYIAMEYVDGQSLSQYCDHHSLDMQARLKLFIAICDGVQHAHYRGIIHRDLKPSNILVSEENNQPLAKIIDFGIAKDTSPNERDDLTCMGELLGTPYYMSPEQAEGLEVDTRTDIYALGVLLYELLTGSLPFARGKGNAISYLQRVVHEPSPLPSHRVRDLGDSNLQVAERRNTQPKQLIKHLKGDLDLIVTKAMSKRREDRYATASELASDILNFLEHKPVLASPPDPLYRMGKFIRRHKAGFSASLVGLTSLIVALIISLNALVKVKQSQSALLQSQQQAIEEAKRSKAFGTVLENILTAADPERDGPQLTVVQLIQRTLPSMSKDMEDQPEVEASLRHTIGQTLASLSHTALAREQLERAFFLRRQSMGETAEPTLESHLLLAQLLREDGRYTDAETVYNQIKELCLKTYGPNHAITLDAESGYAQTIYRQSKYQETHDLLLPILAKQRQQFGDKSPQCFNNRLLLANSLYQIKFETKAEAMCQELFSDAHAMLGEAHPETLRFGNALGNLYLRSRNYDKAQAIYEQVLSAREKVLGPHHRGTLITRNNLGSLHYRQRNYATAKRYYLETLELQKQTLHASHPDIMMSQNNVANCLRREGKTQEARALYQKTLEVLDTSIGPGHIETVRTRINLCKILLQEGQVAALRRHAETVIQARPDTASAYFFLGRAHYMSGHIEGAAKAFERYGELMPQTFDYCSWYGLTQLILGQEKKAMATLEAALAHVNKASDLQTFIATLDEAEKQYGPLQSYAKVRETLVRPRP